jgi:YVTN family beta-propeller protein
MKAPLLKHELPLQDEGEAFLYVQPFPQEAERLKFNLDKISALKSDGTEYPLILALTELNVSVVNRQTSLASGHLPPGSYSGLSIKVGKASLKGEEGDAALLVPDEPVKINFPFTITAKKAIVISMSFRYSESLREEVKFVPFFSLAVPGRFPITLAGYVTNSGSHSITVFDKRAGLVASVIETGSGPSGIVLNKSARKAFVALTEEDSIDVIDIDSERSIGSVRLNRGDSPRELVLAQNGASLLVVNSGSDSVSVIDPYSLVEIKRLNVGNGPASIILDRTGRKAYVFNSLSNNISVIDVPTRSVTATIATDQGPIRGQFNARGDKLFVFYERTPYLTVLDPFAFTVIKRIYVGLGVSAIKVDNRTDMIYLGRKYDDIIEVYDPFSLMPNETFSVGGGVNYMTIDSEGNNLCLVLPEKKRLVVVNLISKRIVAEMDVGTDPFWITLMEER